MSQKPGSRITLRQLLWHGMMGTALGILCAGMLLVSRLPELQPFLDDLSSALARLLFLLAIGLSFGLCATLTGAMFLVNEQSS